jgi:hypothetical protein
MDTSSKISAKSIFSQNSVRANRSPAMLGADLGPEAQKDTRLQERIPSQSSARHSAGEKPFACPRARQGARHCERHAAKAVRQGERAGSGPQANEARPLAKAGREAGRRICRKAPKASKAKHDYGPTRASMGCLRRASGDSPHGDPRKNARRHCNSRRQQQYREPLGSGQQILGNQRCFKPRYLRRQGASRRCRRVSSIRNAPERAAKAR